MPGLGNHFPGDPLPFPRALRLVTDRRDVLHDDLHVHAARHLQHVRIYGNIHQQLRYLPGRPVVCGPSPREYQRAAGNSRTPKCSTDIPVCVSCSLWFVRALSQLIDQILWIFEPKNGTTSRAPGRPRPALLRHPLKQAASPLRSPNHLQPLRRTAHPFTSSRRPVNGYRLLILRVAKVPWRIEKHRPLHPPDDLIVEQPAAVMWSRPVC